MVPVFWNGSLTGTRGADPIQKGYMPERPCMFEFFQHTRGMRMAHTTDADWSWKPPFKPGERVILLRPITLNQNVIPANTLGTVDTLSPPAMLDDRWDRSGIRILLDGYRREPLVMFHAYYIAGRRGLLDTTLPPDAPLDKKGEPFFVGLDGGVKRFLTIATPDLDFEGRYGTNRPAFDIIVRPKGGITIPEATRKRWGIETGDVVGIEIAYHSARASPGEDAATLPVPEPPAPKKIPPPGYDTETGDYIGDEDPRSLSLDFEDDE